MRTNKSKLIANLAAVIIASVAMGEALALETVVTAPSKSTAGADIALFYGRSTADTGDSYFNESFGAGLGLDWAPTEYTAFRLAGSLTREIGVSDEKFRMSNTTLSVGFPAYMPIDDLSFTSRASVTAPTNEDDRTYLTYRGSLGLSGSVVKTFTSLNSFLNRLSLVGLVNVSRSFFDFEASREGSLNTYWAGTVGISAGYSIIEYLTAGLGVRNTRTWNSNGGRGLDRYRVDYNLTYKSEPDFSFRLEYATTDRTFNYDYVSSNIALYDAEIGSVVGTLTYDI